MRTTIKYGIDLGHNCFPDIGAQGIRRDEDELIRDVGYLLISSLVEMGHDVILTTPRSATSVNDSLRKRWTLANKEKVDFFASIHFNAFDKKVGGTEVFAASPRGRLVAAQVVNNIAALGFKNRGVKDGLKLQVVRETTMPAILIECCFCDNKQDMDIFDEGKMAMAILEGLLKFQLSST